MTVLILSLWAFGVLLLIAFAVYRGRAAHTASDTPFAMHSAELEDYEIAELATRVRVATSNHKKHQILRDPVTGKYKVKPFVSSGLLHSGKFVASAGKPQKPGLKGTHVHLTKPGKAAR